MNPPIMGEDDPIATYDRMTEIRTDVADVGRQREGPHRKHYEWPATRSLLPEVDGLRVLDAGCGNGDYSEWLADHGASVVGVDLSERSIEYERSHVSGDVEFHHADLREPLAFAAPDEFDLVMSQLALDHIEQWTPVFEEFARILRPRGHVVCAVGNPVYDFLHDDAEVYYEIEQLELPWGGLGCHDYRRPFSELLQPLLEAGFQLERLDEPTPQPGFAEAEPEEFDLHTRIPRYVCLKARLG